jgi:acyl carrier protein
MQEKLKERIKEIIAEELMAEKEAVTDDAHLREDLGADSLDLVELLMRFEDEFDIQIPEEEAEGIKTVGDIIKKFEKLGIKEENKRA